MAKYLFHFSPDLTKEKTRSFVVTFFMLLHSHGAWPSTIHRTGDSKQKALKTAFDLTREDAIHLEMGRVVSDRSWPKLATQSYWGQSQDETERYVAMFFTNTHAWKWPNTLHLEVPDRVKLAVEQMVMHLQQEAAVPFIVKEFSNTGGEVRRVSRGNGGWASVNEDVNEYRRLMKTVTK